MRSEQNIDSDSVYAYALLMHATSAIVCLAGRVPLDPLLAELLGGGECVFGSALEFPSQEAIKDIAAKIVASVTQQK